MINILISNLKALADIFIIFYSYLCGILNNHMIEYSFRNFVFGPFIFSFIVVSYILLSSFIAVLTMNSGETAGEKVKYFIPFVRWWFLGHSKRLTIIGLLAVVTSTFLFLCPINVIADIEVLKNFVNTFSVNQDISRIPFLFYNGTAKSVSEILPSGTYPSFAVTMILFTNFVSKCLLIIKVGGRR